MSDNDDALKALGIRKNITYSVVPVGCTEHTCISHALCQDNAIGLVDDENGGFMICHDYKTAFHRCGCDKKVFWQRVGDKK